MLHLHEHTTTRVALSRQDAAALARLSQAPDLSSESDSPKVLKSLTPAPAPGLYDVRPGPYVGRLAVTPGLALDIASQFAFRDLFEMIATAARTPLLPPGPPVPLGAGQGLADVIALGYSQELDHIVGVGLAKAYVERWFTRPPYPGVPDAPAHLARAAGRPDRLVTRAKRLTTDTEPNQVLAAALDALLQQPLDVVSTRERLRSSRTAFADITRLIRPTALVRSRVLSAPPHYRRAMGLAGVILAGGSLLADGPEHQGPSLLFAMPAVWEAYLQVVLTKELPPGHQLVAQHRIPLTDSGPAMTARADLVELASDGTPVRVLDAKYKELRIHPSADDLYQMVTYAQRLRVREAVLLYPGRGEVQELRVDGLVVTVRGVDVLA